MISVIVWYITAERSARRGQSHIVTNAVCWISVKRQVWNNTSCEFYLHYCGNIDYYKLFALGEDLWKSI